MYTKNNNVNLMYSDYELTPLDEHIFNETGYVLHDVDEDIIHYKSDFGTTYEKTLITIDVDGNITASICHRSEFEEADFEDVEISDELMHLMKLKYEEMMHMHPNGEAWANSLIWFVEVDIVLEAFNKTLSRLYFEEVEDITSKDKDK